MAHKQHGAGRYSYASEPASPSAEPGPPVSRRRGGAGHELRLALLGFPQISLDGQPLTFARRRAVALLVYLIVTGRPHSREALVEL
jgi:hypothetical protein